ncbi:hypothetical protein SEA_MADIBA_84 [Mycobacterium phage Madiba]|nr:hypothetical protein SEA_MADIBA_84 [Mycobacterium phage Madiba]
MSDDAFRASVKAAVDKLRALIAGVKK